MISGYESYIKSAAWSLVFCVIFLVAACSDDKPVEKVEPEATAKEEPLPVREWYPRQKYYSAQQPQFSQPQMMQPPVHSDSQPAQPAQQPAWGSGYQVYQAPPVIIVQPQSQWYGSGTAGQAPAQQTTMPQQYVSPYYYQAPQRPWGVVPQNSQSGQQTYTQSPVRGQQVNPWSSWQEPGGVVYPGYRVPFGGYPGVPAPGYVW